jgi:hypothetical protein
LCVLNLSNAVNLVVRVIIFYQWTILLLICFSRHLVWFICEYVHRPECVSNTSSYRDVFSVDNQVQEYFSDLNAWVFFFCTAKLTAKLLYYLSLVLSQDDLDLANSQAYWPCSNTMKALDFFFLRRWRLVGGGSIRLANTEHAGCTASLRRVGHLDGGYTWW